MHGSHELAITFLYLFVNVDLNILWGGLGVVVFTPREGEDGGEEAGHNFEGGQVTSPCLRGAARRCPIRRT